MENGVVKSVKANNAYCWVLWHRSRLPGIVNSNISLPGIVKTQAVLGKAAVSQRLISSEVVMVNDGHPNVIRQDGNSRVAYPR